MDSRVFCRSLVIVCMLALACNGCAKHRTAKVKELEAVQQLGSLPLLRQTHDPRLKAELARIVAEKATPELLASQDIKSSTSETLLSAEQLAIKLSQLVTPVELQAALRQLDKIYPAGKFQFGPVRLRQALQLESQFAQQRREYIDLFTQPNFRFRVNWLRGLLADLSFIEHAELCHRLLAIGVADSLAAGQPSEAVLPLRQMLDIDCKLAEVENVAARMAAVDLHAEALRVLESVLQHPRSSVDMATVFFAVVQDQLQNWPPDQRAWIGDRALGLHTYEMVRDGRLLSILSEAEIRELKKKQQYVAFVKAVTESVDADERFYLAAMRELIAACDRPFYQRSANYNDFHEKLDEVRDTPRFPLFAAKILFPGIESSQREQALDRAGFEAWSLALATMLGKTAQPKQVNPLTGEPFKIERTEQAIEVSAIDPDNPEYRIQLPRR